jgi:UDP-N-acetylglucosamine--N-acetylmuramyl-(pentapeptide) pyrophosphoryl-undecaprenol N-acetylglucosamine transferase
VNDRPRILFFTSNGTGLGHLTRAMAIARRLDERFEPLMFTLSAAAPVVREQGFPVEFCASYRTPGAGTEWRWSRRLRGRARAALADAKPALVVFDGAHPYLGFLDALRAERPRAVWCRRAMWKPGANRPALPRAAAFDAVLEPGELAADADRGPTVARRAEAHRVGPIVYLDRSELRPRAEAERELGLEPGATNVLVALGQGAEVRAASERCVRHLAGREGVQLAVLESAIAAGLDVPAGVVHLRSTYPMSRNYAAFDLVVAAAGYNGFHELLELGVPALFVPIARETDDQATRASWAAAVGLAGTVAAPDAAELERELDRLLDPAERGRIAARLAELPRATGSQAAAAWLAGLASGAAAGGGARRASSARAARNWHLPGGSPREAAEFIARVPRGTAALAKQLLTSPRPPRTVILALGLRGGDLERDVAAALERTPDPPQRILVITDSLDFGPLRRLGVGFEHVPAAGERQAELAGGDYETFLRRRLALILAERRRPARTIAIGDADAATLHAVL